MKRWKRAAVRGLVGTCLVALIGCAGAVSDGPADRPSILLITVDGLVAADIEPFGGAQPMPRLKRLVESGMAWPAAVTAVPMTRPAVATYLTGLAPDRHGVRDDLFAVLPAEIPTLAERLSAAGYRTAGFPGSSFLAERSGLWRGFEAVDPPAPVPMNASRWLSLMRPPEQAAEAVSAWLDGLKEGTDWFGWVHLSVPLIGQFNQERIGSKTKLTEDGFKAMTQDADAAYEKALADFDNVLGQILDAVDSETWVLLAGTMADQRNDGTPLLPGPGYSLAPRSVEVPVIARLATGTVGRGPDEGVWAPDVAATVAAAAGVELSAQAEGVSLTEPAPERTVFSWSWALLDQMGWRALALARDGERELLVGAAAEDAEETDPGLAALRRALDERANPRREGLPQDEVEALLAAYEIEPSPLPEEGRDFDDAEKRKWIAGKLWGFRHGGGSGPGAFFTRVRKTADPLNYAAHLDGGQALAFRGVDRAKRVTEKAVQLRPDDPEAWHFYAHAIWPESVESAERILTAIQPYLANQADALYDLACARSLAGDLEVSADYLAQAYLAGFRNRLHINSDPDLRNLRESEHFSRVMQRFH